MAIITTKWKPDTCDCVIEYKWDNTLLDTDRVHTVSNVVNKCVFHEGSATKEECYTKVHDENTRKNKVYGFLIEESTATVDIIDNNGDITKKLVKGKEYKWHFDENRNLVVNMGAFTKQEKDSVNLKLVEFGNKVIII